MSGFSRTNTHASKTAKGAVRTTRQFRVSQVQFDDFVAVTLAGVFHVRIDRRANPLSRVSTKALLSGL